MTGIDKFLSMNQGQKAKAFDRIAEEFYKKNFGRFSKGDMDVLMFSILVEETIKRNYSDYEIASQLGITEARVRSFRIKAHLVYSDAEDGWWRKEFCEAIYSAKYDDSTFKIVMPILNPNVRREIEAYIDSKQWYNEYQLNPKLLIMRPDQFISLYVSLIKEDGNDIDEDKVSKKLKKELASNPASGIFDETSFVNTWKNQGPGEAMKNIAKKAPAAIVNIMLTAVASGMIEGDLAGAVVCPEMWIAAINSFISRIG